MKSWIYYFCLKMKILADFQICISVHLSELIWANMPVSDLSGFWRLRRFCKKHMHSFQHLLELTWSAPFCYVTSGVADLSWNTSISNQVWHYDGVILKIFINSIDLRRISRFFKKVFKFWNTESSNFCVRLHHYVQY